ncbi:FecCD family ABC transporter permease [Gracilibacillus suaedae]|uniref:FecCD family ABC transporter permease n=1 Tax=Gracilibacillus suaedae TaxID=2820273 RepID=UPI001ABEE45C|nr:iron ABC transporter permease [Gracilibacillus suaedae]
MNVVIRNRRRKWIILLLPILLVITCIFSLTYGSVDIAIKEIWSVIIENDQSTFHTIIWELRLPRILIGLLVGACLAVSGALLQGVMKNPLADPGIIGVTAGGGLMASITMLVFPAYGYLLPITAFIGSFVTAIIVYGVAWDKGASAFKIILAGVAINALLGAVQNGIMVIFSDRVQAVIPWLAGGLSGRGWYHFSFIAPYAIIGLLLSLFAIRSANLLMLGDESAKLLGQKVELHRFLLITLAAFLAGIAVSVAGLIGFVGLVIPHIVRLFIGEDYRYLLPVSALGGAILVVFSDTIARSLFDPIELPVGVLLAGLGAPFFLYLLKNRGLI